MQSAVLGVTVSMLVRIALLRYLGTVSRKSAVPWWRLFWYGIKFNKRVDFHSFGEHGVLVKEFLNTSPFLLQDY